MVSVALSVGKRQSGAVASNCRKKMTLDDVRWIRHWASHEGKDLSIAKQVETIRDMLSFRHLGAEGLESLLRGDTWYDPDSDPLMYSDRKPGSRGTKGNKSRTGLPKPAGSGMVPLLGVAMEHLTIRCPKTVWNAFAKEHGWSSVGAMIREAVADLMEEESVQSSAGGGS